MSGHPETDIASEQTPVRGKVGIVVLAAGSSSRLGMPKQLLLQQGQSLIARAVQTAIASQCDPVVVVLGAYAQEVRPDVDTLGVRIVETQEWSEGMSASLRAGLKALTADGEEISAVVFMVCDQPLITPQLIDQLVNTYYQTGAPIVASEYGGKMGVPALFAQPLFPELMALRGAGGAKQVISNHAPEVRSLPFPEGELDIDTLADYQRVCSSAGGTTYAHPPTPKAEQP